MDYLAYLLNLSSPSKMEMSKIISNYLLDKGATENKYEYDDVVSLYTTPKSMAAICLEAKRYYFSNGIVENRKPIGKLPYYSNGALYFDTYGDLYLHNHGVFYEICIGLSEKKDYKVKELEDFNDD